MPNRSPGPKSPSKKLQVAAPKPGPTASSDAADMSKPSANAVTSVATTTAKTALVPTKESTVPPSDKTITAKSTTSKSTTAKSTAANSVTAKKTKKANKGTVLGVDGAKVEKKVKKVADKAKVVVANVSENGRTLRNGKKC